MKALAIHSSPPRYRTRMVPSEKPAATVRPVGSTVSGAHASAVPRSWAESEAASARAPA